MEKEFINMLKDTATSDKLFDDYIDAKCIEAVNENSDYIEKERSGKYNEYELSVMREKLIFKKAWMSAFQLAIECKII